MLTDLKDRNRLFWVLQTSGWLLFLAISLLYYLVRGALTIPVFARYTSGTVAGFLTTLLLRLIYKKIGIRDRAVPSLSLIIIALSLLGANLTILGAQVFMMPFAGMRAPKGRFAPAVYSGRVLWWSIPLIGWSALYAGLKFWQEWMAQKECTDKAMALAQAAQFQMIRYRMNPHFLFNTLNSIRALISEDKAAAKDMVTELSEFLRYSLVSRNFENVPLKEEMDSLRHYMNIEKMRYENKLDVTFHIDPAAEDYPVASFLLHPLAENALKYGMATSPLPLKVQIAAGVHHGRLHVEIINSGSWVEPAPPGAGPNVGRGLANVRRRLADAYPDHHHLDVFEQQGCVHARLVIGKDMQR